MARYDLAAMARRNGKRRTTTLRAIIPPAVMATDLYRAVYLPAIELWEAAEPRIMAEYERSLPVMAQDSAADVQAELNLAGSAMQSLFMTLTPELRDWVLGLEQWQREKWKAAVLAASNVDLSTLIGPEDVRETLETAIARNVGLLKDVGAQTQGRISEAVFRGLTQRQPAREVAKSIREALDMSRRRAKNIAAHQLSAISSELADERRREAGLDTWAWVHSGKRNPRETHLARSGNLYSDNPARQGQTVQGKTVMKPPEASDLPGRPPFCGCTSRGVLVLS